MMPLRDDVDMMQREIPYSPLEELPLLVLESICEYLLTGETRRRSLFAFTLASKRCCVAAARQRFSRFHLAIENESQLELQLERLNATFQPGNCYRFVRWVVITGHMAYHGENDQEVQWNEEFLKSVEEVYWRDKAGLNEYFSPSSWKCEGSVPMLSPETRKKSNARWKPLAGFLAKCPGLKHITWASPDPIPRCILDALHEHVPSARLHVEAFILRSLYQYDGKLPDIDEDDYFLASSPSLESIYVEVRDYDEKRILNYHEEAVYEMMSGTAPNLRRIKINYRNFAWLDGHLNLAVPVVYPSRPIWEGFSRDKHSGDLALERQPQGRITSLQTMGFRACMPENLSKWIRCTDFSKLHSLRLISVWLHHQSLEVLRTLIELASTDGLASLRIFSHLIFESERTIAFAGELYSKLRQLEDLSVAGLCNEAAMTATLRDPWLSLRRLSLPYRFSEQRLLDLQQSCPNVQSLKIATKRMLGTEEEVRTYQALGSFRKLERLSLQLQCTYVGGLNEVEGRSQDDIQVQYMRLAFMNSAIDEHLAQSMFAVIFSATTTSARGLVPSLRFLEVACSSEISEESRVSLPNGFHGLRRWLERSWVCERKRCDAFDDTVITREIKEHWRDQMERDLRAGKEPNGDREGQDSDDMRTCGLAWTETWPASKDSDEWFNCWHSFALWQDA